MKYNQGQELREFNYLYRKIEELYHNFSLKIGLSDSAFAILYAICEEGDGCSQKLLCQQLSMSKQTIHSAIRKLEKEEILWLKKEEKARERYIYLTEKGIELVQKKIHPVMELEERVFLKMPEQEKEEFLRLTRKYVKAMTEEGNEFLTREEV